MTADFEGGSIQSDGGPVLLVHTQPAKLRYDVRDRMSHGFGGAAPSCSDRSSLLARIPLDQASLAL